MPVEAPVTTANGQALSGMWEDLATVIRVARSPSGRRRGSSVNKRRFRSSRPLEGGRSLFDVSASGDLCVIQGDVLCVTDIKGSRPSSWWRFETEAEVPRVQRRW